jgi:dihydrofolate reductase
MMISVNGYFEGRNHDLSWHNVDAEFDDFAARQLDAADTLLFGHRTYTMMAAYWPKATGRQDNPVVAAKMNSLPKLVFSRQHFEPDWAHTRLVKDTMAADELVKLKQQPGKDLLVLGSSNFCVGLLEQSLLDELRLMVAPVLVAAGTPLFAGLTHPAPLQLTQTQTFDSGNVLLTYAVKH